MLKHKVGLTYLCCISFVILLLPSCDSASTKNSQGQDANEKSWFDVKNEELDEVIKSLRDLKYKFYSRAFQLESYRCRNYELELTYTIDNYTQHDIEAMVCRVAFYDKLGNYLDSDEIMIYDRIPSGQVVQRKDRMSMKNASSLCSLKQNEIEILFMPPSIIEGRAPQQKNTMRTSNVIIAFSDKVEVYAHDYDFRFLARRSDRIEEMIAQIENIVNHLRP